MKNLKDKIKYFFSDESEAGYVVACLIVAGLFVAAYWAIFHPFF